MVEISKTKSELLQEINDLRKKIEDLENVAAAGTNRELLAGATLPESEQVILVVDDSSIVRASLERDLTATGYKVLEAESGREAIRKLKEYPSLILLDMHMPGMDGLEVLQNIRQNKELNSIPVVMLTAMGEIENRMNCFAAGADDYLLKPYLKKELLIRIKRLLEVRRLNLNLKDEIIKHEESEKKFRVIFDKAPAGVAIINSESGRFLRVNQKYCDIVGRDESELMDMNFQQLTHPDDIESDLSNMQNMIEGSIQRFSMDKRYIRKDGTVIWVNLTCEPMWESDSDPRHNLAIVIDITERKKMEEAIRASSDEWRLTFDSMSDLIMLLDTEQTILRANKAMTERFGKSFKELLGKKCYEIVHEDGKKPHQCPNDMTIVTGSICNIEANIGGRDYLVSTSPMIRDGVISGTIHIMKDVSEMKKLEQELMKIEKLEAVGVLAGGIAHDFNNILMALWGNIQLAVINTPPDSPNLDLLIESEKACRRARDLTYQLLTFARGGAPIKKVMVIESFIKDSCNFALSGSKSKSVYTFGENLWPVNADEGQLNQALSNLVINASQAMPEGGEIMITVRNYILEKTNGGKTLPLPEGKYVMISIADSGAGIPEERLQKIFDPYFTTKKSGSGLGLATTYSIVKRHDGHISVASTLGKGSVFTIYLPASDEIAEEAANNENIIHGVGKILVMDDDVNVRDIVGGILKNLGYSPEFASEGDEAVEMFSKARESGAPFDAVILDLTVPGGLGGAECIGKFLDIDRSVKAIVSSGYSTAPIMADYKKYGFRGVLTKPFKIAEVGRILNNLLMKH